MVKDKLRYWIWRHLPKPWRIYFGVMGMGELSVENPEHHSQETLGLTVGELLESAKKYDG